MLGRQTLRCSVHASNCGLSFSHSKYISAIMYCCKAIYECIALLLLLLLLLRPGRGAEYCDQAVCLCVCLSVREHISGTAGPICTKFCMQMPCGRGSVLLRRRCAMLCISGFMDDVMFGRNRREAG